MKIRELFANQIDRRIEEVIKVDQTDEQVIADEIGEYVLTDSIEGFYRQILNRYQETPNKPHEGIAVWVSGFFGSGKSSFAKMLGLAIENRNILDQQASELFANRTADNRIKVHLKAINEHIPTDAVIFDVSTDRGIRTGNQTLTEIMYRLFLKRLGYASDLDLSELEITLESEGRLEDFKARFSEQFDGKEWDAEKEKTVVAIPRASKIMQLLEPGTFSAPDSWAKTGLRKTDITPGKLAERCKELMDRRRPGRNLMFVVDEVGQFVARDVQKMLDLQAVIQSLGRIGRGRFWVVVTSQEKLNELVGGLDDKKVELARLMDRFSEQPHLEPSDISEVTSKRVLSKNAKAQSHLIEVFNQHRGRLESSTRISADIKLPALSADQFAFLYPLLPYQIDLIIQIVSGLRTSGGAGQHVGGANRTIIKLAQQLLIHPDVDLANREVGALVTLDRIYDLVSQNIPSEIREKVSDIGKKLKHPMAMAVAKAVCLLQYVKSIHRTAENIAATLHPSIEGDPCLQDVKDALEELKSTHMIREGDDGYRIPTPAEDDWERQRHGLEPRPGDFNRIYSETIQFLWQPQPQHRLKDTKNFKAGLLVKDKLVVEGDTPFHLQLVDPGEDITNTGSDLRRRSQSETSGVFWLVALTERIATQAVELYRSKEMLSRKERGAQTREEGALVSEEKLRMRKHQEELRRLMAQAALSGNIFFRGNDRSPEENSQEVGKAVSTVLQRILPDVYERFEEAAAKVSPKDIEAVLTHENLVGLPDVYTELGLIGSVKGTPTFITDGGVLLEVLTKIDTKFQYGDPATGRYLESEFGKEPFGWDFDVLRLMVASLLRAGAIEVTSNGQTFENAMSLEAKQTFSKNPSFRAASFRLKKGLEPTDLIDANDALKTTFGKEAGELQESAIARMIRAELKQREPSLQEAMGLLSAGHLPGLEDLQDASSQLRNITGGNDEQAVIAFKGCHRELGEALKRASHLVEALDETQQTNLSRAKKAVGSTWNILKNESDLPSSVVEANEQLSDHLLKPNFYTELAVIDQLTKKIESEFQSRQSKAKEDRKTVYEEGLKTISSLPGFSDLKEDQVDYLVKPLKRLIEKTEADEDISLIREQIEACPAKIDKAIKEIVRLTSVREVETIKTGEIFRGGIANQEQLDQALNTLRERCEKILASGKNVMLG